MAGRGGSRGDGAGEDRDAQRARERAARERARAHARAKTGEQALEARVRLREEANLRAAAADRQAEEARERRRAAAAQEHLASEPTAAAEPPPPTGPATPPAALPDSDTAGLFDDFGLPPYARPATRAGRERQAVFAPAEPVRPAPSSSDHHEAERGARPARAAGTSGVAAVLAALLSGWGQLTMVVSRRPRIAAGGLAAAVVLIVGFAIGAGGGDQDGAVDEASVTEQADDAEQARAKSPYGVPTDTPLPPETRIVAYTGAPQAKELGILGTLPFEQAADRLDRQAVPYDRASRPVLPAFDLIATIANADPGPDGKYRTRQTSAVIARYLRAARRHDAMLILDVQPGGSNFIDETKALRRWLKEPDVHLALDPEWRMRPGVRPGSEIGYVSAGEITATLDLVSDIVVDNDLPPKLVLVHRFTDGMIRDLGAVQVPKEVVGVISIDGVGSRPLKESTYDRIAPTLPKPWLAGFKLFYEEDAEAGGVMYGSQVMALKPRPHVVLYE